MDNLSFSGYFHLLVKTLNINSLDLTIGRRPPENNLIPPLIDIGNRCLSCISLGSNIVLSGWSAPPFSDDKIANFLRMITHDLQYVLHTAFPTVLK